jgi:8-amino-7-oxononanoate synthase
MLTATAIVPVLCGTDERAYQMTAAAHHEGLFVLPVVSPAVPPGLSRLRATVTAAHEAEDIERAMDIIQAAGKQVGVI